MLVVSIDFYGNTVYNKAIEKNGTAQRAERKITMKQFEIGKTYTMASPCDRNCVWTYTVTKRTAKTITISDGTETKTCRVNTQVSEDRNAETIFPLGRYSMCPALSADKEEMPKVQEPAEEAKAEAKIITFPRRNVMEKAERYLERLRREKESWENKLKTDPHIMESGVLYRTALCRIERYNAARYMMKLMQEEDAE